jgi:hypothetical protein
VMGSLGETLEELEEAVEAACKEYEAMLRLEGGFDGGWRGSVRRG